MNNAEYYLILHHYKLKLLSHKILNQMKESKMLVNTSRLVMNRTMMSLLLVMNIFNREHLEHFNS